MMTERPTKYNCLSGCNMNMQSSLVQARRLQEKFLQDEMDRTPVFEKTEDIYTTSREFEAELVIST